MEEEMGEQRRRRKERGEHKGRRGEAGPEREVCLGTGQVTGLLHLQHSLAWSPEHIADNAEQAWEPSAALSGLHGGARRKPQADSLLPGSSLICLLLASPASNSW